MTPLVVIQSMATRRLLERLAPLFSRRTGRDVVLRAMGGVEAARLILAGEPADLVILAADPMARLAEEGLLLADSLRDVARAEMVAAVPAGAPLPDLTTPDAVRDAIVAAGRVAYSTGPSGDHLMALCRAWALAVDPPRFVLAPPGVAVGTLLARGEADLGFQQRSEFVGLPGVAVVGPLPRGVHATTMFTAGISRTSRQAAAAGDLLDDLVSSRADAEKIALGLEPAESR